LEIRKQEQEFRKLQMLVEKEKQEKEAALNAPTAEEREEKEKMDKAVAITQRKMLAHRYEQMMIEDEKREGFDGGSNFQVIADQQAEQNYMVNIYKGSGNMDSMFKELEKDAQLEKATKIAKQQIALMQAEQLAS